MKDLKQGNKLKKEKKDLSISKKINYLKVEIKLTKNYLSRLKEIDNKKVLGKNKKLRFSFNDFER